MIAPPIRPKDHDAERGLLSCLIKGDVIAVALDEGVNLKTFIDPLHATIWEAMLAVDKAKEDINEISVLQKLGTKRIEDLGKDEIWGVFNSCDTSGHAHRFASAAREVERMRGLQSLALTMLDKVGMGEVPSSEVIEQADRTLFGMNAQEGGLKDGVEVEEAAWKDFMEARESGGKNGYPTGLADLDNMLGGGLRRRTLNVLAARPSTGKTALALQIAAQLMNTKGVYFQSLEMNAGALGKRLVSHLSEVPVHLIESGNLDNLQHHAVEEARSELRGSMLNLDDKGGVSMALCRAKARRVKDLGLIVIDYCGLVSPADPRVPREQQIAGISKDAKMLAEELDCPVLLLSQLNRAVEQAARDPKLSDLRESGALEQDADSVLFLHQPDKDDRERVMLLLAKNRHGRTGMSSLKFDRTTQTFKPPYVAAKKEYRSPFGD